MSMTYSQKLNSIWKKRFGEEVDESLLYIVSVERVLQMEDFKEVFGVLYSVFEYLVSLVIFMVTKFHLCPLNLEHNRVLLYVSVPKLMFC